MARFAHPAAAKRRVALVIGNGAYSKGPRLENPRNDAAAMEAMLKAAGFETVVRVNDLGVAAFKKALRDFSDTAFDAETAVVVYAGHGMEVGGISYLIPTDAVLERDIDVADEAISLVTVPSLPTPRPGRSAGGSQCADPGSIPVDDGRPLAVPLYRTLQRSLISLLRDLGNGLIVAFKA